MTDRRCRSCGHAREDHVFVTDEHGSADDPEPEPESGPAESDPAASRSLQDLRERACLSQEDLASKAGIDLMWVQWAEYGTRSVPELFGQRLADALDVPLGDIEFAPVANDPATTTTPSTSSAMSMPPTDGAVVESAQRRFFRRHRTWTVVAVVVVLFALSDNGPVGSLLGGEVSASTVTDEVDYWLRDEVGATTDSCTRAETSGDTEVFSYWSCTDEDDDDWCFEVKDLGDGTVEVDNNGLDDDGECSASE